MLETGGITSALQTLNVDDETIAAVVSALKNAVDGVHPQTFHGSARVGAAGFGDTDDALDLSTQYDLAFGVIHQFLVDTVTDIESFSEGVTKAKSLFIDADDLSHDQLRSVSAGVSQMNDAAHRWGA